MIERFYLMIQNNGLPQEVKHFHLHLMPCYKEKQELFEVEDVYNHALERAFSGLKLEYPFACHY